MRTIGQVIVAAIVVLAVFAGGCGDDSCPAESPQVNAIADCTAVAGQTVNYEIRLCPTCNQTLSGCEADLSGATSNGGTIFLNPTVEACSPPTSCGPGCNLNATTCTFRAPTASPNTIYTVQVFDPQTNQTKSGTLTIVTASPSCSLPST